MTVYRRRISVCVLGIVSAVWSSFACPSAIAQRDRTLAEGQFSSATFSRSGKTLLTAGRRKVQLWDVETGKLIREFEGHRASIFSVSFSPHENHVLTSAGNAGLFGPEDPTSRLWNVKTGKQLAEFDNSRDPIIKKLSPGYSNYVQSAQFSPDGKQIVAFSILGHVKGDIAVMWDAETREQLFVLTGLTSLSMATHRFQQVRFSPCGKTLAGLASDSTQIRLWDAKTGAVIWQVDCPRHGLERKKHLGSIEFSPDGKLLLAVSSDKMARIWDLSTRQSLRLLRGHTSLIFASKFCFDGKSIMTASKDGTARLWDTDSGRQVRQFQHSGPIMEMEINNDSTRMVTKWRRSKENTAQKGNQWRASIWDVKTGREVRQFELSSPSRGPYTPIVFTPNGRQILMKLKTEKVVLIDARTGEIQRNFTDRN